MRIAAPVDLPAGRRPRVSVVIPCYRYGHFLADATRSALDQPGVDVDVVIVDDASPDGSGDVAAALAAGDDRVRALQHEVNRGHIATYGDGLAEVTGDYCTLLSADDLLTSGSLERSVSVLERHPSVGLVYGHPRNFTGVPPTDSPTEVRSWTLWSGHRWIRGRARTARNPIYSPEAVVRTSVQRAVGGYELSLPHTADLELWLRVAAVADVARVNGPVQALRRVHGANMSETDFGSAVDDLVERGAAFQHFFQHAGRELPCAARLRQRARLAVVRQVLDFAYDLMETGAPEVEVDTALKAATGLDPLHEHRAWRELAVRRHAGLWAGPARMPYVASRAVRRRVDWHAWRRAGL